jgi:iron complex outermembrane receptor protein
MSTSSGRCSGWRGAARRASAALCVTAGSALAQTGGEGDGGLPRVIVTGSQVPRVDAESALPVQILTRQEIERSGALSVEELMTHISANFGGINEAMGVGNPVFQGFSGASLRGFGSRSTLVLLNGRRVANHAFSDNEGIGVDLHAIPLAAIDRVEVLTDGASAIYGSDAIAGVINFILRRDFRGAEASVERAIAQAGGAARQHETLALGAGDAAVDGFNLFGVIDHQRQQALAARKRAFAATSYRPELGLDKTSANAFPANIQIADDSYVNPAAPACTDFTVFKQGGCWYDYPRQVDILPQTDNFGALMRGTLALPQAAEAYAELLWSRQRARYAIAASPVNRFAFIDVPPVVIPEGSPFYPKGLGLSGDIVDPSYRAVSLGPRTNLVTTEHWRALLGWRGAVAGWDADSALMQSVSRSANDYVGGYVDALKVLDGFTSGRINAFGDSGPEGDALLASSEVRGRSRGSRGSTTGADFRASRDIAKWSAGPVTLGLGAEARREALHDHTTALADIAAGGTFRAPTSGARDAQALFAELALPLLPKLDAQLALRADRYSDFGTSTSPKLALRWQPTKSLLLRASAGTGFRAPSLPELFMAQIVANDVTSFADPKRCPVTHLDEDCATNTHLVQYVIGGNPALRPELSRQASLGLVFEPVESTSIGLDWWHLTLEHTILPLNDEVVLSGNDRYEGRNIVRGPPDPAFPNLPGPIVRLIETNENVGRQTASGVDVNLRYRTAPGAYGRFAAQLSGSYLADWRVAFDGEHDESLTSTARYPRWQHTLTLGWERGTWNATLVQTWRASYRDENPDANAAPRRVAPYRVWDAQIGYAARRDLDLVLGVKNLFDRDPPFTNQQSSMQVGYDPSYADPRGRVWYARAGYRWR